MEMSPFVRAETRFDVEALLFAEIVSVVVVEIVEVMFSVVPAAVMVVPAVVPGLTRRVSGKLTEAPAASVAPLQLIVPVPPTAGVMQVQPAGGVIDWKVVFGGVVMVYVGVLAVEVPRFEMICV